MFDSVREENQTYFIAPDSCDCFTDIGDLPYPSNRGGLMWNMC